MGREHATRYRRLAALHRAGVPWSVAVGDVLGAEARQRVGGGASLADLLADAVAGGRSAPLDRALLIAGESSGRLESVLERLADRHEATARRRSELVRLLLYPMLVAHIGALAAALPDLLRGRPGAAALWALALLGPAWLGWWWVQRLFAPQGTVRGGDPSGPARRARGTGAVLDADHDALLALADAHDAGLPLDRAALLAASAGAGGRVAEDLVAGARAVAAGRSLASAWKATPPHVADELATGEAAGDLARACRHGAARLADEAASWRAHWRAILPVVAILVLGAVVAWRVIGFYRGLYESILAR
jgi:type II secretory pathway component PulF